MTSEAQTPAGPPAGVERLFTDEFFDDPYPIYRALREQGPVLRLGDTGSWLFTGFDAVYGALRNHEVFSSAALAGSAPGAAGDGPSLPMVLITDDPPRHTRFRGLVNRAFTPRRIAALEPWIETVVDELLDGVAGEVDAVRTLSVPLPVTVIATLLGIPVTHRERFKRWSSALLAAGASEQRRSELAEMVSYFGQVVARRREEAAEDLISALVEAEVEGESLEDWEVLGFCILLLVAGNETTTNLIGNMLNVLVDRPDLWRRLREDRSLVEPVIEETLRFDSPVQALGRRTTRDVEVEGQIIAAGSGVTVSYAAGNRDPAEFPAPDEFRLDRDLNRHIAFGIGVHYCLGAPLARAEARIALNALLDRYGAIARGEAAARRQTASRIVRGFERLPLVLRP